MNHRQAVLNKVKELLSLGNKQFHNAQIRMHEVEVKFILRGKVAGKAQTSPHLRLSFHPQLMERDIEGYMSTVEHEVAHLFQRKLYPTSKPHGREFKMVARKLGNDGSRCHNHDTTGIGRAKQRFIYECKNGCNKEYMLTAYKHNIQQTSLAYGSGRFYLCPRCKSKLYWTGDETIIH